MSRSHRSTRAKLTKGKVTNSCLHEFPGDDRWNQLVHLFQETGRVGRARLGKLRETVCVAAAIYEEHEPRWDRYLAERRVKRGRRGPTAASQFHALLKGGLALDGNADKAGVASKLSHVLDEWCEVARHRSAEQGGPVDAANIDVWIEQRGGNLKEIAKAHRDRKADVGDSQADLLRLFDLPHLLETEAADVLGGYDGWFRPLCRIQHGKLRVTDIGEPVGQGWLLTNSKRIVAARTVPDQQDNSRRQNENESNGEPTRGDAELSPDQEHPEHKSVMVISQEDEPGLDQAVNSEQNKRADEGESQVPPCIGQEGSITTDAVSARNQWERRDREGDPRVRVYLPNLVKSRHNAKIGPTQAVQTSVLNVGRHTSR